MHICMYIHIYIYIYTWHVCPGPQSINNMLSIIRYQHRTGTDGYRDGEDWMEGGMDGQLKNVRALAT